MNRTHPSNAVAGARSAGPYLVACLAVSTLALGGCGNKQASNEKPPSIEDTGVEAPTTSGAHDATAGPSGGESSMSAAEGDTALIQAYFAKEFKVDPADVKVRIDKAVAVPGITLFSAQPDPKKVRNQSSQKGILEGGAVYFETEAMSRVLKAWKYGPERTVPAADFARVMAFLHSRSHRVTTYLNQASVDRVRPTLHPGHAAAIAPPKELMVDGLPAVQYSLKSGDRGMPPFSVVTAIVKPDYQIELRQTKIDK